MKSLLAAAALMAALPAPAAQPPLMPSPVRAVDPAAVAAARDLLEAGHFDELFERSARLTAQTTFGTVLATLEEQHGTDFPDDLELELHRIVDEHIEGSLAIVLRTALEDTARIYARYFSAEEIRELQRLQAHPVMVRYQQVAPQFVAELTQVGIATDVARMPELQQRIDAAIAAWIAQQARHGEGPAT